MRSGVKLHPAELQVQRVRDGADEHRLAEAGDALEQDVPAGDERGQRALDDVRLPDDQLADLLAEPLEVPAKPVEFVFDGFHAHRLALPRLMFDSRSYRFFSCTPRWPQLTCLRLPSPAAVVKCPLGKSFEIETNQTPGR